MIGPIAIFIILVFASVLISSRIKQTVLTTPILFTLGGIGWYLIAPRLAEREIHNHTVLLLTEIALAVLLFTDASRIHLGDVLRKTELPVRLLGIVMPLVMILGAIAALLVFDGFSIWEAALLAVILSPTDASLGQVVVNSRLVPERIRQGLNVEAGLNDGLAMPFFTLFASLAVTTELTVSGDWVVYSAMQIGFGVLAGAVIGWLGGWLLGSAGKRGWIDKPLMQLGLLALAIMCYGGGTLVQGNGFIAAFVGGMLVRRGFEDAHSHSAEFSEAWGQILNYFIFFIFGVVAADNFVLIDIRMVVYAILSLTVIRMLPTAVAMIGTRLSYASMMFMGWFGPRGLASIVLALVLMEHELEIINQSVIVQTVMATVLLSVFAHGFSAWPGIKWYSRKTETLDPSAPEFASPGESR